MTSNQVPPSVTYPSPNEWPQNLIHSITGITKAAQAQITAPSHGFTSADIGITFVDFTQVKGMIQINGLTGIIQSVIDANNFTVNINSTQFFTYSSGGQLHTVSNEPPVETIGAQVMNTPFKNTFSSN